MRELQSKIKGHRFSGHGVQCTMCHIKRRHFAFGNNFFKVLSLLEKRRAFTIKRHHILNMWLHYLVKCKRSKMHKLKNIGEPNWKRATTEMPKSSMCWAMRVGIFSPADRGVSKAS